ncbi:MAG: Hpt domain-containing protein [Deltaproteobacteria bacterium]|nr:Hpt domain-containing protein [Deltaproteobacteria bacterium]
MSSPAPAVARKPLSIRALRNLIFLALILGLSAFTAVMFTLTQRLTDQVGPQVHADLVWRVERGAQELAHSADLGLAVSDADMVKEAFGVYKTSSDVIAIVAIDTEGKVVAQHGTSPEAVPGLFGGKAGEMRSAEGYLVAWAPAEIEGAVVGKVAVVVSTAREADAMALLSSVSSTTLVAGAAALVLGLLVIGFFTHAVAKRDVQLKDYAANLERKVEERTAELDARNRGMRLVLDNVAQGFMTIDARGVLASERSAIVDRWFGEPAPGATFADLVRPHNPDFATWFPLAFEAVTDDCLPLELALDQLPRQLVTAARTYGIAYSPILDGEKVVQLLVIVSDVTEHLIREQAEREQREMVTLFQRISADRAGFEEFLAETSAMVASLATPGDPVVERRVIHTLKGNSGIYGLDGYAALCHAVEGELAEHAAPVDDGQRARLTDGWKAVVTRANTLLGGVQRDIAEVRRDELVRLADKARAGVSSRDLAAVLVAWTHDPVQRQFERLGHHGRSLARRLGKGEIRIDAPDTTLRLETNRWAGFWSALVHAVRNAIDHGLEDEATRAAAGKPAAGTLQFAASQTPDSLTIEVRDDGRGIDWAAIRSRAERLGLPHQSQDDLVEAMFADGVSTREQATSTSGRGVGMSALRQAVRDLDGRIVIASAPGAGTTLRFMFPYTDALLQPLRQPTGPIRRVG